MTSDVVFELQLEVVVSAANRVAEGVVALTLVPRSGQTLPPWTPGAHVDLILPGAPDGSGSSEPIVRQYSLCGDTEDRTSWQVAVLRVEDSRGGSSYVHDHLREGDVVQVRGPRNHFTLVPSPSYVFIAGGIGITPLLPMIAETIGAGAAWTLFYGGRSASSMAFLDRLQAYGPNVQLVPQDDVGFLDLDAILGTARSDTLVYCCGPEGLLNAVEQRCASWSAGSLHLERFSAKEQQGDNSAFNIVLERSGITLEVPADSSIYQVCRENDISVLGSCLEGICGTCETDVLEGEVEHRDVVLDEEERNSNQTMMICVSRCRGRQLTLDL